MISVHVHERGVTTRAEQVRPEWLQPGSAVTFWLDVTAPGTDDERLLADVLHFHPLAVEDALSAIQFPKIEPYADYLYLVLHRIDTGGAHDISTRDIDFFLGRNYLVTVHDGGSRSIARVQEVCARHDQVLADGPAGLMHRIVDSMVDNYRPVIEEIEDRVGALEEQIFGAQQQMVREILTLKRELGAMRRVLIPQRDALGRLARREFAQISDEIAFRFRDVHDHVVRLTEETILFQDRVNGILEVNLATVSNRLNQVMKLLAVISTIFLPLTVLTGMWGMNVPLPHFPGGEAAQFWWVAGGMLIVVGTMLAMFRRKGWL